MIVRKLRLQRGWSQETLAELAGVSVRTIQRIERGKEPGIETAKALASVFEVPFSSLRTGDDPMNTNDSIESSTTETAEALTSPSVSDDEKQAMQYVKGLKEFYTHAGMYAIFLICFIALGQFSEPKMIWGFLGWGVGVVLHGLVAYEVIGLFSAGWEKRM
ncbi:MAG: helix-turn-helix domain-containing protein, partial [Pseudomonadota bacterium]